MKLSLMCRHISDLSCRKGKKHAFVQQVRSLLEGGLHRPLLVDSTFDLQFGRINIVLNCMPSSVFGVRGKVKSGKSLSLTSALIPC
jgi:hypothetical protein